MNNLSVEQIIDFFAKQVQAHPEITEPNPLSREIPLEHYRVRTIGTTITKQDVVRKTDPQYVGFLGEVYRVSTGYSSIILAYYTDDETILWLDNHSSNDDYKIFIHREHLLKWLPSQADRFVSLLVETKFNFFIDAMLVRSISEIPSISQERKRLLIQYGGQNDILKSENLLREVSDQIYPPTFKVDEDNVIQLSYCVWLRAYGRLLHINTFIDPIGTLQYSGNEIAMMVGDYTIPR